MGTVIQFRRPRKTGVKARPHKRWRVPNGIWFLALAFIGIAVAENFKFERGESGIGLPFSSDAASGSGKFGRCINASQKNCVIDGDTIRYQGEKVRFSDIDTPELRKPKCASEAALAEKATQRLVELVNSGSFSLKNSNGDAEDIYGRRLSIAQINGRSVGDTLIAEGLARRWDGARRSWCG